MNKLAVSAFIGSMVGLAGGLFFIAFFALTILCFVLGIIALIQILHRKERGLFFAIGAILGVVGFFTLLLLLSAQAP